MIKLANLPAECDFLRELKIMTLLRSFGIFLVISWTSALLPYAMLADDDYPITFGFTGPEIFPIDSQISQLHAADLDGDGYNDLIVVNNARAKINLLYNQTGKT